MKRPLLLALLAVVGCRGGDDEVVRGSVGPEGGTLTLDGVRLDIPPGALSETTEITLERVRGPAVPEELVLGGDMVEILPSDLRLALPATLTLAYSPDLMPVGSTTPVTVYTAPSGGTASDFVPLPTTIVDATHVSVEVDHFSYYVPLFDRQIENSCGPGVECGAGNFCIFCAFPICVPLETVCCGASVCMPVDGVPAMCVTCSDGELGCIGPGESC